MPLFQSEADVKITVPDDPGYEMNVCYHHIQDVVVDVAPQTMQLVALTPNDHVPCDMEDRT